MVRRRAATGGGDAGEGEAAAGFPGRRLAFPRLRVALESMEPCCRVTISPGGRGKARENEA